MDSLSWASSSLGSSGGLRLADVSLASWAPPSRGCLYMCAFYQLFPSAVITLVTGSGRTLIQGNPSDPHLNHR